MSKSSLKKSELPSLRADIFIKYRDIYKKFLEGKSITELSNEFQYHKIGIRKAVNYMLVYCDYKFEDEAEIKLARQKADHRIQELRVLKTTAEASSKHGVALNCMKEIRANEELIYKLNGMLGLQIPGDGTGSIVLITGIDLGKNKPPKQKEVINVTPIVKGLPSAG